MSFRQFVALIASLMAVSALGIDTMLPALATIGDSLHIKADNQRQWIVTAYLLGMGVAQIVYGTLADRYGRRPILLAGLGLYVSFSIVAAFSQSFETMLIARILQGLGAAAARVLSVSIVRDCYSGRPMARVMSFSFIVFLAVPILAPSLGEAILLIAPWRAIFGVVAGFSLLIMVFVATRLPETLHPEDRMPISPRRVGGAFKIVLTNRVAVGYTLALALIVGGMFSFLNSAQQLFSDAFHAPRLFPVIFAFIAAFVAVASMLNARVVGRLGMRLVSHAALVGYIAVAVLHAGFAVTGRETLVVFALLQASMMFCMGLVGSNFSAMAMEPLGHMAGTASSVQGFVTTVGGALIGIIIGQHFDGTAIPLTIGFASLGSGAFLMVLITEKGRMFKPTEAGIASAAGSS